MNEKPILYSTGCPRCRVLMMKLEKAGVEFDTVKDVKRMTEIGLKTAPALSVDGKILDFAAACKWADAQKE